MNIMSPSVPRILQNWRRFGIAVFAFSFVAQSLNAASGSGTETVRLALGSMGGETAWATIKSAKITGTLTFSGARTPRSFARVDAWSLERDWFLRSESDSSLMGNGGTPNLIKYDPSSVNALAADLPVAALSLMIQDPQVSISEVSPSTAGPCVVIAKYIAFVRKRLYLATWCFSSVTHLPVTAQVNVLDRRTYQPAGLQSITYKDFGAEPGGTTIPHTVQITESPGRSYVLNIEEFAPNIQITLPKPEVRQ